MRRKVSAENNKVASVPAVHDNIETTHNVHVVQVDVHAIRNVYAYGICVSIPYLCCITINALAKKQSAQKIQHALLFVLS